MRRATVALAFFAAACTAHDPMRSVKPAGSPQAELFANITRLCGKAFEGRLVSADAVDADFAKARLVMHVRSCTDDEIRIPLHVGDDRSRTWVITKEGDGLELRHDHRHKDGSEDVLTQYGGFSSTLSHERRAEFPVDDFSKALFTRENRNVSNTNVWAIEVWPEENKFAYELKRPQRFFRLEFDTSKPVAAPPAPWGSE